MSAPGAAPEILRITNAIADLSRLYPWFEDAAAKLGLPKPLVQKMQVVAEEAVMNVAMHAYAPGSEDKIEVRLSASQAIAELVVEDCGPAFDPLAVTEQPRPASLAEAKVGGLGLNLLKRFCPDISYARLNGRNQLRLRFPLESPAAHV
ncbi:MAG: ATP-binding protein [Acidocella sp.]|nr:ATP-binding protein [Acidocella sp.]